MAALIQKNLNHRGTEKTNKNALIKSFPRGSYPVFKNLDARSHGHDRLNRYFLKELSVLCGSRNQFNSASV
jgi:hypothetical protein